jgi:hypothetical protein
MYGQRAAYIEQDVKPLIAYYEEKQKGHRIAIEGQKDRAENCAKVEYMSY